MNGDGFKCDQCGKAVIVPVPPGAYRQTPANAPLQWFVLLGPTEKDVGVNVPTLHLCSVACVAAWSHNTLAAAAAEVTP